MRIALGSDHRGWGLKQAVIGLLMKKGYEFEDFGCYSTEASDYPDFAQRVAQAVAKGGFEYGILICGTGIGMSIAANKVKGIRAALCYSPLAARLARQHNNANVLCLAGEGAEEGLIEEIVTTFLNTEFEGGRHAARLEKIKAMELGIIDNH